MDAELRELERRAFDGDIEVKVRLMRARIRAGGRDPRRWPRAGDVVRVAKHGTGLERWDVRRVVPCVETRSWVTPIACWCILIHGGTNVPPPSFAATSPAIHWERTTRSFETLARWGLARDRRGTLARLGSWRSWAKPGEVVTIAGSGGR